MPATLVKSYWTSGNLVFAESVAGNNGAIYFGIDDYGLDVKFFGATASNYLLWDQSADQLQLVKTSASTSGSTSVESMVVSTTLTGAGGVGGRARFALTASAAAGGWVNALKAITTFGASGAVTGMGSALCAEMVLSAGTTAGTYAPLESEMYMAETAKSGASSSFLYANVDGHATGITEFLHNGFLFELGAGCTIDTTHIVAASAKSAINATHGIRVKVAGTTLYIPAHTSLAFGV